jgi:hypothetical protein
MSRRAEIVLTRRSSSSCCARARRRRQQQRAARLAALDADVVRAAGILEIWIDLR